MKKIGFALIALVLGTVAMISCNNDSSDDLGPGQGTGEVNIYLTDAPFPVDLVDKTFVTIDKVEIRKQETDTAEAKFVVLMNEAIDIDLLTLSNGVTELMASVDLEAGTYDMIRMHVTDSKVVLKNGTEYDLKVPSGSSSGLKVKISPSMEISNGQTADVLLDFDVSKSFVAKGNWQGGIINGFNFKPVVRGVLLGMTGKIEGMVSDTTGTMLEDASVKVWMPGEGMEADSLITSSFTNDEGKYQVIGVLSGTYYLTTELDSFMTDTVWNVNVSEGQSTQVDFVLTPEQ